MGNTLVFLLHMIGSNPDVQTKLYNEVADLAPPGCDLSVDDLRTAKYLRACITEAFRYIKKLIFKLRNIKKTFKISRENRNKMFPNFKKLTHFQSPTPKNTKSHKKKKKRNFPTRSF